MEGASCVNMGNNFPSHFHSQKKHNQGFGEVSGDNNRLSGTKSALDDADFIDWLNGGAPADIPEPVRQWLADLARETSRQQAGGGFPSPDPE